MENFEKAILELEEGKKPSGNLLTIDDLRYFIEKKEEMLRDFSLVYLCEDEGIDLTAKLRREITLLSESLEDKIDKEVNNMTTCTLCKLPASKLYKLTSSEFFNGKMVCKDCYQNNQLHEGQLNIFGDKSISKTISFDFDKELDYEEFKILLGELDYKNASDFFIEIQMNPRSAVQTWKKKGEIPFLVKAYLENKIDKYNNVGVKEIVKFVEITKFPN